MERYKNLDGDSAVTGYEFGSDYIRVEFDGLHVYLYTNDSAGEINIDQMKRLAASGEGLNSFINRNVRKKYARKEK